MPKRKTKSTPVAAALPAIHQPPNMDPEDDTLVRQSPEGPSHLTDYLSDSHDGLSHATHNNTHYNATANSYHLKDNLGSVLASEAVASDGWCPGNLHETPAEEQSLVMPSHHQRHQSSSSSTYFPEAGMPSSFQQSAAAVSDGKQCAEQQQQLHDDEPMGASATMVTQEQEQTPDMLAPQFKDYEEEAGGLMKEWHEKEIQMASNDNDDDLRIHNDIDKMHGEEKRSSPHGDTVKVGDLMSNEAYDGKYPRFDQGEVQGKNLNFDEQMPPSEQVVEDEQQQQQPTAEEQTKLAAQEAVRQAAVAIFDQNLDSDGEDDSDDDSDDEDSSSDSEDVAEEQQEESGQGEAPVGQSRPQESTYGEAGPIENSEPLIDNGGDDQNVDQDPCDTFEDTQEALHCDSYSRNEEKDKSNFKSPSGDSHEDGSQFRSSQSRRRQRDMTPSSDKNTPLVSNPVTQSQPSFSLTNELASAPRNTNGQEQELDISPVLLRDTTSSYSFHAPATAQDFQSPEYADSKLSPYAFHSDHAKNNSLSAKLSLPVLSKDLKVQEEKESEAGKSTAGNQWDIKRSSADASFPAGKPHTNSSSEASLSNDHPEVRQLGESSSCQGGKGRDPNLPPYNDSRIYTDEEAAAVIKQYLNGDRGRKLKATVDSEAVADANKYDEGNHKISSEPDHFVTDESKALRDDSRPSILDSHSVGEITVENQSKKEASLAKIDQKGNPKRLKATHEGRAATANSQVDSPSSVVSSECSDESSKIDTGSNEDFQSNRESPKRDAASTQHVTFSYRSSREEAANVNNAYDRPVHAGQSHCISPKNGSRDDSEHFSDDEEPIDASALTDTLCKRYFSEPDTYSIPSHARLLGFDVPPGTCEASILDEDDHRTWPYVEDDPSIIETRHRVSVSIFRKDNPENLSSNTTTSTSVKRCAAQLKGKKFYPVESGDISVRLRGKPNVNSGLDFTLTDREGNESALDVSRIDVSSDFDWKFQESLPLDEIPEIMECMEHDLRFLERRNEQKARLVLDRMVHECREYHDAKEKRAKDEEILQKFENHEHTEEVRESYAQIERDMDRFCDVCLGEDDACDGGGLGNKTVFCTKCDIGLHQNCYGINEVLDSDFLCYPCQKNEKNPVCELCTVPSSAAKGLLPCVGATDGSIGEKWVHALCAKWQNLDLESMNIHSDDLADITDDFRRRGAVCCLCKGARGAFVECPAKDCRNVMHATCASLFPKCFIDYNEGCMSCPEHSREILKEDTEESPVISEVRREKAHPLKQLKAFAKRFPSDHPPFASLTCAKQRKALMDPSYESHLLEDLDALHAGARCDVCDANFGIYLERCVSCKSSICGNCLLPSELRGDGRKRDYCCLMCRDLKSKQDTITEFPGCSVCCKKGGWMRRARAAPVKTWANNRQGFAKTLFAKDLWCHAICSRTHIEYEKQDIGGGTVDLSKVVLATGKTFVKASKACSLCGRKDGLKQRCSVRSCKCDFGRGAHFFHPTCARQAGLSVFHQDPADDKFTVRCLIHSRPDENFRAKVEELVDTEEYRLNKRGAHFGDNEAMAHDEASTIFHASLEVVRILGWAWKWCEWWVETGFSWEIYIPYLKPGETEEDYPELVKEKTVHSTKESRSEDAIRCRLAAVGAALRNRQYDTPEGCDNESLERALRAVLETKSLVGPLKDAEVDFCVEWLARAYRSKSRHLGLGDDKIEVGSASFLFHRADRTPKFELGTSPPPGRELGNGFDDDEAQRTAVKRKPGRPRKNAAKRGRPPKTKTTEAAPENGLTVKPTLKRKRGRPPKAKTTEAAPENALTEPPKKKAAVIGSAPASTVKRKRGRPRKNLQEGPGRPRKNKEASIPLEPALEPSVSLHEFVEETSEADEMPATTTAASRQAESADDVQVVDSLYGQGEATKLDTGTDVVIPSSIGGAYKTTHECHDDDDDDDDIRGSYTAPTQMHVSKQKELHTPSPDSDNDLDGAPADCGDTKEAAQENETGPGMGTSAAADSQNKSHESTHMAKTPCPPEGSVDGMKETPVVGKAVAGHTPRFNKRKLPLGGKTTEAEDSGKKRRTSLFEESDEVQLDLSCNSKQRTNKGAGDEEVANQSDDDADEGEQEVDASSYGSGLEGDADEEEEEEDDDDDDDDGIKDDETQKTGLTFRTRRNFEAETARLMVATQRKSGGRKSSGTSVTAAMTPSEAQSHKSTGNLRLKANGTKTPRWGAKSKENADKFVERYFPDLSVHDGPHSGKVLHVRKKKDVDDDYSEITNFTKMHWALPRGDENLEEEVPAPVATNKNFSDQESILKAIEDDKKSPISRTITREDCNLKKDHTCTLPDLKRDERQPCVLCCKKSKINTGCGQCYLEAFEAKHRVKIDRNNIPDYFKRKIVFLCTERPVTEDEELPDDDISETASGTRMTNCFKIWHSAKPLPRLDPFCKAAK